MTAAPCP